MFPKKCTAGGCSFCPPSRQELETRGVPRMRVLLCLCCCRRRPTRADGLGAGGLLNVLSWFGVEFQLGRICFVGKGGRGLYKIHNFISVCQLCVCSLISSVCLSRFLLSLVHRTYRETERSLLSASPSSIIPWSTMYADNA